MATGFGLRLVGRVGGGAARVREYVGLASYGTALYVGDPVVLAATGAMDATGQIIAVEAAAAAVAITGVIVGFDSDISNPYITHRAASTLRKVYVCDDPDAIFEVQEDAVGAAVTQAQIGVMENADIIVAAGNAYTGLSGVMLDSSDHKTGSAQLKIIGVRRDQENAGAATAGAILLVTILEHSLRTADSQG